MARAASQPQWPGGLRPGAQIGARRVGVELSGSDSCVGNQRGTRAAHTRGAGEGAWPSRKAPDLEPQVGDRFTAAGGIGLTRFMMLNTLSILK